ncbi:MAG: hypothetical protein AAGB93_14835 [Planctomycetota bacterium]
MQQLPKSLLRTSLLLGALLALFAATGCGRVTHVGGPSNPAPESFVEREPNDSPWMADFVSFVDRNSFLLVDGHVEAIGVDVVDHIEFEATEPVEIEFFLEAFGPFGDVDVSIYDPIDDVVLGTYAISGAYESGTIVVHEPGRPFQFVIEAYSDDSPWTLELVAYPHACACSATSAPSGDGAEERLDVSTDADSAALSSADSPGDATGVPGDAERSVRPRPIELLVGP